MLARNIHSDELEKIEYSLLISALGFENRATAVAKRLIPRLTHGVAIGFDHNHGCSYSLNETWFRENDFHLFPNIDNNDFANSLAQHLSPILTKIKELDQKNEIFIAIDISCFDRRRMADIVQWLRKLASPSIIIDFWYSIGAFQPPSRSLGRNEVAGPVHRNFAGQFTEPGRPLALVAGLGYELGRVMGAAEYLQASYVVTFIPDSPVVEYENEVNLANKTMLQDLEARQILHYSVSDPERTIAMLDSTIRGLGEQYNVVLLPGGPKIFALCSLIASTLHRHAAVWRVSSGGSINLRECLSSPYFVGLRWDYR